MPQRILFITYINQKKGEKWGGIPHSEQVGNIWIFFLLAGSLRLNLGQSICKYRLRKANLDSDKKYAFIKNPQFLPKNYGTSSKLSIHEYVILTECHNYWVKIVDFLLKAYFLSKSKFPLPTLYYQIEMSVLEILNIGSAAAGVTSVFLGVI